MAAEDAAGRIGRVAPRTLASLASLIRRRGRIVVLAMALGVPALALVQPGTAYAYTCSGSYPCFVGGDVTSTTSYISGALAEGAPQSWGTVHVPIQFGPHSIKED